MIKSTSLVNNKGEIIMVCKGAKNGHFSHEYDNGDSYVGDFADGKRNGFGVYKSKRGSRYEGQWADDVRSGLGNMTFTTPSLEDKSGEDNSKWAGSYDGQWENNLKHGKGVFLYENGDKYDGSWKEGKKCGFGKYTYANGDRYEGEFHADNMHGVGVFLNSEGHASGRWQNDVRIGRFVVTNSQGTFEEIYDTKGSMTSRNKLNLDGK